MGMRVEDDPSPTMNEMLAEEWADRPDAEFHGKDLHVRASSLGGCIRRLAASAGGFGQNPTPSSLLEVFYGGIEAEDEWCMMHQIPNEYRQQRVRLDLFHGIVEGSLDVLTPTEIVELKSTAMTEEELRAVWGKGRDELPPLFKKYLWQVSAYYHAIPREKVRLEFIRRRGHADEEPIGSVIYSVVLTDELLFDKKMIDERLRSIREHVDSPMAAACPSDWGCPFDYLHEGDLVEDREMQRLVHQYVWCRDQSKLMSDRKSEISKVILDRSRKLGIPKGLLMDGTRFQVMRGRVTRSMDWKKLEEDGLLEELEPWIKESVGNESVRVTIPKKKTEGEMGVGGDE